MTPDPPPTDARPEGSQPKAPSVSVIIPCYNYGRFVGEAIDSVLASDYRGDIEIVVVDDGSTDQTPEVLATYAGRIKTLRHTPNRGKAAATRTAIAAAGGEYLFNLDADDRFSPDKIRRVIEIFEHHPDVVLVGQAWRFFGDDLPVPRLQPIPDELRDRPIDGMRLLEHFYLRSNMFGAGSAYAAPLAKLRGIEIPDAVDVWVDEYLVLMTLQQGQGYLSGEPLFDCRIHGANVSNDPRKAIQRADAAATVNKRIATLPFSARLKSAYEIHARVLHLYRQQLQGRQPWPEVLALWRYVLAHRGILDIPMATLTARHHLLLRSLPLGLIDTLRRLAPPWRQVT